MRGAEAGMSGPRFVAALAAVSFCAAAFAGGAPLVVATWNLRLDLASDGANAWPQRRETAKALVRWHRFDLMATQEGLPHQVDELAAMPGWAFVGVGRDDGRRGGEHAALFYRPARLELLAHGDFWLSETPDRPSKGWDGRCCHRLATWARFTDRESGRRFTAMSVHFDHEGVLARRESAHLVLARATALAEGGPLLLLGDFNAAPGSEPIAILGAALRDARAVSESPPYGPQGTFNDFKPWQPAGERIDWQWVSRQVRVHRYGVLTDTLDGRAPSDHYPVVTELSFD